MVVSAVSPGDLDWMVEVLRRRRQELVPHAPVFWRPAPDADARHRAYLDHLITDAGARAWRTPSSVLVAARRGEGWLVDDLVVADEEWVTDGRDLWNAFATVCRGEAVRFVSPTYDAARGELAAAASLAVSESWWLIELEGLGGGEVGVPVMLSGARAVTVAAPPVYAPPGPILFLPTATAAALPTALDRAPELGCAAVVVSAVAGEEDAISALTNCGFRRHCDFFEGRVHPV